MVLWWAVETSGYAFTFYKPLSARDVVTFPIEDLRAAKNIDDMGAIGQ